MADNNHYVRKFSLTFALVNVTLVPNFVVTSLGSSTEDTSTVMETSFCPAVNSEIFIQYHLLCIGVIPI